MNLVAIIPSGQAEITVNGLHQWDYGRKLEIHLDKALASVEVHFACVGMDEAVVRVCNATEGVAVATIPDTCLEQTSPITAWVYEINGTTGVTTKKITLPVEARTRPSATEDIPIEISDKYTEAVTAMNEAIQSFSKGDVKVSKAGWADVTGLANDALRAEEAKYASADKTKGTIEARLTSLGDTATSIEERLTALGFKSGAVTPVTGSAVVSGENILKRQGNYVIGVYHGAWSGASGLTGYSSDNIGTIPVEFRPKTKITLYGCVYGFVYGTGNVAAPAYITIDPNGSMDIDTILNPYNGDVVVHAVYVSLGYDAVT